MNEIQKLRQRLINAGSSAREYRMTLQEAKDLLADIDNELTLAAKKIVHIQPQQKDPVAVQHVILDGGSMFYPPDYSPPEFKLPNGVLSKPE